jgi:pyridoxine/pyridoxamine 5'-phosphate oxidase
MLEQLFEEIKQEWKSCHKSRSHPFKYVTLTTITEEGFPRSRTVAVREVNDQLETILFTDSRSNKVTDVETTTKACMLAYHPKQMKQLRWDGNLIPINDPIEVKRLFQKVGEKSLRDYTTISRPGSSIENPDAINYESRKEAHFLPMKFVPHQIEYLKINRPHHIRALFTITDSVWKGEWLTP